MSLAAAPAGPDRCPSAPIASRWPQPSGRKNAHRGLGACRTLASGKSCSQALIASRKNPRSPTTARQSHLLQQSNPATQQSDPEQAAPQQSDPYAPAQLGQVTVTGASVSNDQYVLTSNTISTNNVELFLDNLSRLHIFGRHVWWPLGNTSRYLDQFGNTNAINQLFSLTVNSTIGFPQPNGNYYFSANLGFIVGTDQAGLDTTWNTVIVKMIQEPTPTTPGFGRVVTMYPGQ